MSPAGTFAPLPWRRITPLNKQLGPRSLRFNYPGGVGIPLLASPQTISLRYGPEVGIDRLIGFTLAIANTVTPTVFTLTENNTGWLYSFNYPGNKGVFNLINIETLPDEASLTWTFTVNPSANVYLSFFNFEIVPFELV